MRTWFEILSALGAYPKTHPDLPINDNPSVVSRTTPYVACRFPNGTTSIATHYRSHEESWPGGFHRDAEKDKAKADEVFGALSGSCRDIDRTDGVRMTFDSDEVVHLRPSGNAPEFRCYNEAAAPDRAGELNAACMKILASMKS